MREFVSSATNLDSFKKEENSILKRKWLEVLNEILCYGSTLGIQSDVPGEVSEVAHQIVRMSITDGIDFKISEVHIGLAGKQSCRWFLKFSCKGQVISEWKFDALNFPKKPMEKFDEFLPENLEIG